MKSGPGLIIVFFISIPLALLVCPVIPLGAEEKTADRTAAAQHLLSVNRSLTAKAEVEIRALEEDEALHPSELTERKLKNLGYKIKALKEEAAKTLTALPKNRQANEFLKDLILQKKHQTKKISSKNLVAELHEQALKLVTEKKLKEAAKLYEEIILVDPDNDEAYLLLGHTSLMGGDYQKAENAFASAIQIDPDNVREILPFYQNIALQNPGDDTAYSNLGFVYLMVGDYLKAQEAFKDALGIDPENTEAKKGLKVISEHLG